MRPHFPDARRGLQYRDGNEAPDVIAGPFLFECKRGKKTNPKAALKQATECQKAKGFYPIAVTKDDFEEPIVTLYSQDFLELIDQGLLKVE